MRARGSRMAAAFVHSVYWLLLFISPVHQSMYRQASPYARLAAAAPEQALKHVCALQLGSIPSPKLTLCCTPSCRVIQVGGMGEPSIITHIFSKQPRRRKHRDLYGKRPAGEAYSEEWPEKSRDQCASCFESFLREPDVLAELRLPCGHSFCDICMANIMREVRGGCM